MTFTPRIPMNELDLIASAHHRNGVSGAPFDVALFNYEQSRKLAVIFNAPFHCAVLDIEDLARGGVESRWRGDAFETNLRMLLKLKG
jgi:hypothetical protein